MTFGADALLNDIGDAGVRRADMASTWVEEAMVEKLYGWLG